MTASRPSRPRPGPCGPWVGPPKRHRPAETATARARPRSADGQVLGALLVIAGVGWLLDRSGAVNVTWQTIVSLLLLALGAGMVLTARRRGGPGLVVLGAILAVVLLASSSVGAGLLDEGIGTRSIAPIRLAVAQEGAQFGVGQLDVDLTQLDVPQVSEGDKPTPLRYRLGVGHLIVRLPPASSAAVTVRAAARGGKIEVPDGKLRKGSDLEVAYRDPDFASAPRKLTIDLAIGLGVVQVVREGG